nr:helix-turn-helix transcriptional regulator [Brucella anthropi]
MRDDTLDHAAVGKRIRQLRHDNMGLSQEAFAALLGVTRGAVGNWELGKGIKFENLQKIALILDQPVEWLATGRGSSVQDFRNSPLVTGTKKVPTEKPNAIIGEKVTGAGVMVPVYGQAVGGIDGQFLMNGTILYEVMAPPQIAAISGAYGVQISGDSMFPRYEDGEVAFVDPRRRVKKGDYVVAQIQFDEHEPPHAYVKRFVRHNAEELVLSQFNPPKELTFDHDQVVSVHFIALAGVA